MRLADMPRCTATASHGGQCGMRLGIRNGLCLFHDPARVEEAAAARARGTAHANARRQRKVGAEDPIPDLEMTLDGIAHRLAWVNQQLATGKIPAGVASTMTYNLNNLRMALKDRDLELEVKALRAKVRELTRKRAS